MRCLTIRGSGLLLLATSHTGTYLSALPLGPASRPGRETGPRDRAKLRLVRAVCVARGEKINRWGTLLGDAYLRTGSRILETSAEVAAPASAPPYRSCALRRGDYLFLAVRKGNPARKNADLVHGHGAWTQSSACGGPGSQWAPFWCLFRPRPPILRVGIPSRDTSAHGVYTRVLGI